MKTRLSALLPLFLIGVLGLAALVGAQSTPSSLGIVPTPMPQPLAIDVWTDKTAYVVGETMRVYFNVNQPAYIYLYGIQPDGIVRLVFPNLTRRAILSLQERTFSRTIPRTSMR